MRSLKPCTCDEFKFWYSDEGIAYCYCGHDIDEHQDRQGHCNGELVIHHGR